MLCAISQVGRGDVCQERQRVPGTISKSRTAIAYRINAPLKTRRGAPGEVPVEIRATGPLLTLTGTSLGGAKRGTGLPKLFDQLMQGKFDLESLVTHKLPLDKINKGYDMKTRGEGIRSLCIETVGVNGTDFTDRQFAVRRRALLRAEIC